MKKFIKLLLFLLISLISFTLFAQTYIMPINGYSELHTDSGTLYDNGGSSGNYATRVNAKTTIYPLTANSRIIITGTYDIENYNKTKLIIYSGDTNSNTVLFNNLNTTSGTINIKSYTGPITVKFFVDSDNPNSGFVLNISICQICPSLPSLITQVISDSSALITWSGNIGASNWLIEYDDDCDFPLGSGTLLATQDTSILLTNLTHCANYGVRIYFPCDTLENSCPRIITKKCWIQCECALPLSASASSTADSINVFWSYPENDIPWTVLLLYNGEIIDSLTTTNNFTSFDSLNPTQCYTVLIFNNCHNVPLDSICKKREINICTKCPCPEISNLIVTATSDSIFLNWREPNDTIEWIVELYHDSTLISTIITNDTVAVFGGLQSTTSYYFYIYNDCNDSIICPHIDNIMTTCACPIARNVKIENVSNGSVLVTWNNDPTSPGWIVQWSRRGTNIINYDTTITNSISLPLSDTIGYYDLVIHSFCDSLNLICATPIEFINIETAGNCMDYTDLKSTDVTAKYGTYQFPYLYNGLIDNGYLNVSSRHTVHLDTSERDIRTNLALRTIPQGESASVRLGNWNVGGEAESLTYRYEVDTNNYDLMILKYAIVLQDPNHTPADQPSFTLEILNENNILIDSVCGYANFIASNNLGWNSVSGSNVIWKDWTTVGFDIAQYHGQVIKIRLTTYDCKEGGHYGYAYYTLNCGTKKVTSKACGYSETNIFSAPEGFNYRWYSSSQPNTILSTQRIFELVTDSTQNYYCVVSSLENPNCSFIIDAYAGNRFPLADFSYTSIWQPCYFEVQFTNNSKISADGVNPLPSGIGCETVQWIFDDGDIQYIDNPIKQYSSSGDYTVKLVAGLANNQCTDTIEMVISLESPTGILKIIGDSSLCQGESTILTATLEGKYKWNIGDTTQSISITPTTNNTYSVQVMDTSGCPHFASRIVRVHPHYNGIDVFDTVCDNIEYNAQGTILTTSGIYPLNLTSVYGCDSNIILHLTVLPSFFDTSYYTMCDNLEYEFQNLTLDSAGIYKVHYFSMYGCDSVYVLHLTVNPTFNDTLYADIYKGNVYKENGFNESKTGFYTHSFQTINGCDSNLYLDLQVDNILFPNCVTSNGDGVNDVFVIHNLIEQNAFPENELIIYTRQGKLIYEFKNISNKADFWSPAKTNTPTGTYFYRFRGKRHDKTIDTIGVIEVIK